ncbi:MAG TPA: hypothetical protein VKP59_05000 [Candidatus Thermoplasmatota archaeon]|nr:hypothetical protein [Candidatus Thermoplasmatota archaeon]
MEVMVHPRVKKFINDRQEKKVVIEHLKRLKEDPYPSNKHLDIKKLKGKTHIMYRLRIGDNRFEYFIDEGKIWIDSGFKRGRGYR